MQKRSTDRSARPATAVEALSQKRSITLSVAGQKLSIKTDQDEAYMRQLAEHVSGIVEELRAGAKTASVNQLLLLASLTIADDLFQAQDVNNDLREEVQRRTERLIELIDSDSDER